MEQQHQQQEQQPVQRGLMIPDSLARSLPTMVRQTLMKLPPEQQSAFVEAYRRRAKSTGTAYLLWFCLGWHYAYLGRWGWQVLFWLTAGGLLFWWFIDLFRIPGMVRLYNEDVATSVMRDLAILSQA